jgi:hypothetical protein
MNKRLLYIAGGLAAAGLAVFIGLELFLGSIVKAGVNRFAPQITLTKVELAGAHISPLSGVGTLTGLYVGNPKGWSSEKAFYLGKIHIDVAPFSLLGDHIIINEIVIDQPEFVYETKIVASNIGDLLKNIEQTTGGGTKGPEVTTKSGKPIKMVIKKFVLQNGRVTLGVGPAAMTIPMPPVTLTDLGTAENGITPGAVAVAVMRGVTPNIVAASMQALGKAGGTTGAAAAEGVKQAGQAIKNLFGGKK